MLNQIIHADCMDIFPSVKDQGVDLIVTDIPYGAVTKNGSDRAKYDGQLRKVDKGDADLVTFDLIEFLEQCARVTSGSIYIFCGIEQVSTVFQFFDNHKDFMVRQCAWKKTNPAPSNGQHMWLSSMENCIFAKRRKTKFNQLCKSAVWDYPTGRSKIHPTEKPLELIKYLVQSSTDEGDTVFDPCVGSGTTAVAAKVLGRNYIAIEINAEYATAAINRIEQLELSLF
ncbi:DNA-methyltransferase [Paenibacillus farraposensis]|uniref:Methyltransferase n=1 Tax=Paenibacillus farraposensis TaxID=2807095 RepID=A0ABW4DDQ6_9BACL|nr:site-specific DNA-methyltransferase [Paenibacillus farraposensis]MCC3380718.1 site-specific DNA-methyltransferase [Paenibacillus farraposensis]